MKLKELINESYYQGLYHISSSDYITLDNLKISPIPKDKLLGKPYGGFWLAKGLSWLRYVTQNQVGKPTKYIYRIKLKPNAKIYPLTKENIEKHTEKGKLPFLKQLSFEEIFKRYDGLQAYNVGKHKMLWTSAWDVPSVVLFNKKPIQSLEFLGEVKNLIKKKHLTGF